MSDRGAELLAVIWLITSICTALAALAGVHEAWIALAILIHAAATER